MFYQNIPGNLYYTWSYIEFFFFFQISKSVSDWFSFFANFRIPLIPIFGRTNLGAVPFWALTEFGQTPYPKCKPCPSVFFKIFCGRFWKVSNGPPPQIDRNQNIGWGWFSNHFRCGGLPIHNILIVVKIQTKFSLKRTKRGKKGVFLDHVTPPTYHVFAAMCKKNTSPRHDFEMDVPNTCYPNLFFSKTSLEDFENRSMYPPPWPWFWKKTSLEDFEKYCLVRVSKTLKNFKIFSGRFWKVSEVTRFQNPS